MSPFDLAIIKIALMLCNPTYSNGYTVMKKKCLVNAYKAIGNHCKANMSMRVCEGKIISKLVIFK